jgi:hypothetical protein
MRTWRWSLNDGEGDDVTLWPEVPESNGTLMACEPEWSVLPAIIEWLENNQSETEHYQNGTSVDIEIVCMDGDTVLGRWRTSAYLEYHPSYTHTNIEEVTR